MHIGSGRQPTTIDGRLYHLWHNLLDYRGLPRIDQLHLRQIRIYSDNVVTVTRKASRRNDADVAHSENTNAHTLNFSFAFLTVL